jgi:hypothetical protein
MAESQYGAFLRFDSTQLSDNDPCDTDLVRIVRNNMLHAVDTHGSVLVEWMTHGVTSVYTASGATDEYKRAYFSGPLLIRRKADGTPYPLRVQLAANVVSGSCTFRIVVTCGAPAFWEADARLNDGACASATTSSTSSIWLTLDKTLIQLPRERVVERPSSIKIGDVDVTLARIVVYLTYTGSFSGRVAGVYAAEYCGL